MINSAALPNVALRNPPSDRPERFASSSVASPIRPAAGMSATAADTNNHKEVSPLSQRYQLIGATMSRRFSQLPVSERASCRARDTLEIIMSSLDSLSSRGGHGPGRPRPDPA